MPVKKLLILQMRPEDEAADSEFEAILRVGDIPAEKVQRLRLEQFPKPQINPRDYCAIIAGGSPFDVSLDQEKKSSSQKQVEEFFENLFHQVVDEDIPFLGACSGNGLLGRYCGATISGKFSEDIGSALVSITEEGSKDPLLADLPDQFHAMVGHKEACDEVPPGSVLLISSDSCPVQMFRVKQNIYATQFHPEADADEFILRVRIYKHFGYFPPEEADQLIEKIKHMDTPVPKKILKRFVNRYCR